MAHKPIWLWLLQGETDATRFYVLESGVCEVYITRPGAAPEHVRTYEAGRSASFQPAGCLADAKSGCTT